MSRLTKDNYTDDLFEKQKELIKIDEYHEIHYSQANYNEDLWNAVKEKEDLEEQLGCPLEVVFKALKEGIWITREVINCSRYCKQNQEIGFMQHKEDRILMLFDFTNREIGFLDMADRSELWFVCWVKLSDYKKTWWLKEDRSE